MPPATEAVRLITEPAQTVVGPEIVPVGVPVVMVTEAVVLAVPQLPEIVYVIVAVPAAIPVTTPDVLTVATEASLVVHVPPPTVSANVVVPPTHAVVVPVMVPALGEAFTVMLAVALRLPQAFVKV